MINIDNINKDTSGIIIGLTPHDKNCLTKNDVMNNCIAICGNGVSYNKKSKAGKNYSLKQGDKVGIEWSFLSNYIKFFINKQLKVESNFTVFKTRIKNFKISAWI